MIMYTFRCLIATMMCRLYSNRTGLSGYKKSPTQKLFNQKEEITQPTRMKNLSTIIFILVLYTIAAADSYSSSKYYPTQCSRISHNPNFISQDLAKLVGMDATRKMDYVNGAVLEIFFAVEKGKNGLEMDVMVLLGETTVIDVYNWKQVCTTYRITFSKQ